MNQKEKKEFKKLERKMNALHRKHWHQNWWGMLLIGIWAGTLVAVIQIAASVYITLN